MTGAAKGTVLKLLVDLGEACTAYQDATLRNLNSLRLECDEIWSFCGAKNINVPAERRGEPGVGDVWTWVALDADSKLVVSWLVGQRTIHDAVVFITDVAARLRHRIQLTTDGFRPYLVAVEQGFGDDIDFATIRKLYGQDPNLPPQERRYSPAKCIGMDVTIRTGDPDPELISTSYVERQNLTMRMHMRRFTRLTNGFSKKVENHAAAVALHFMHYNFCRIHQTLGVTPAMAAGISDHVWSAEDLCELV
jgi:IS1 family transposase